MFDSPAVEMLRALVEWLPTAAWVAGIPLAVLAIAWLTVRYIPNNKVGVVEKLWSGHGSVPEGCIIALDGEAGLQADVLRGGLHFGLWRWQYVVHKTRLVRLSRRGRSATSTLATANRCRRARRWPAS